MGNRIVRGKKTDYNLEPGFIFVPYSYEKFDTFMVGYSPTTGVVNEWGIMYTRALASNGQLYSSEEIEC